MAAHVSGPSTDDLACVTASNLVRNFGEWQDRALGEPVYILHRGRPKLALASIDFLARLTQRAGSVDNGAALIEAFDEPILMFDDEARLSRRNRAADSYFGLADGLGGFGLSTDRPAEIAILQLARRVTHHRIAERLDVAIAPDSDRRVEVSASPVAGGALIVVRDVSLREAHARSAALVDATTGAIDGQDGLAAAHLNQRGHVALPSFSLARITGVPADQLGTTRFASLFEVRSRAAVGDAVERVLRGGDTETLTAELLVDGASRRAVTVSLSRIATRLGVEGAIALITAERTTGPAGG